MLGHARLDTTQIDTQVSIRKLKQIHEATHPARLYRLSRAASPEPDDMNGPANTPSNDPPDAW